MRISIPSLPSVASRSLRGTLEAGAYIVTDEFPSFTVTLHDAPAGKDITVDTPDARFGRLVAMRIGDLAGGVFLSVKGGNQNDRAVEIWVPDDPKAIEAVCVGVLRALDQMRVAMTSAAPVQPLADVPELLANVVRAIQTSQQQETAAVKVALDGQTLAVLRALDTRYDRLHANLTDEASRIRTVQQGSVDMLKETAVEQHAALFSDLMGYYDRPRWWRFWR